MEGRTTFIIAQRLLTLKSADYILVLDHGHIVQRGKHDMLLSEDGLYREIYDLQLKVARDWGLYISTSRGITSIGLEEPSFPPSFTRMLIH